VQSSACGPGFSGNAGGSHTAAQARRTDDTSEERSDLGALATSFGFDEAGRDPQLAQELHALICSGELQQASLNAELSMLEEQYENAVYAELIYLFSHLRFPPDEARNHWSSINVHRESMEQRLGSPVDVRVAMASYFMHLEELLTHPKIIEWQVYERTRSSAYLDELTQLHNHRCMAERIRESVERQLFTTDEGTARLTVSVGVATCPADATTMDKLVRTAGSAMYLAKSGGKNQVRFYLDSLRSFPRIDQTLEGTLSTDGVTRHPLTTVNLSIGGMLFLTPARVQAGGLLDLRLELPDGRRVIPASGRVVSVESHSSGRFRVAARTIEMNPADRWALVESLRDSSSASV